jgi:hypothetical protein
MEQPALVALDRDLRARAEGVTFVEALLEDVHAEVADQAAADAWADAFGIPFDVAHHVWSGPGEEPPWGRPTPAIPLQWIVRPSDMRILQVQTGAAPDELANAIEAWLGG